MTDLFGPEIGPLPWDLFILWMEKANIRHFDGGQPVELAEVAALAEVWENRGDNR